MTNEELLAEIETRLAITAKDYEALQAKYAECVRELRHYQLHTYWSKDQLEGYLAEAGWEFSSLSANARHGLYGVVEAYLKFRKVVK